MRNSSSEHNDFDNDDAAWPRLAVLHEQHDYVDIDDDALPAALRVALVDYGFCVVLLVEPMPVVVPMRAAAIRRHR